jgi:hypothetical protein
MVFAQASAPTGWTKSTANNDKALRVVNGSGGGTGGSVAFETAFASQTIPTHSLSTSELPNLAHDHELKGYTGTMGSLDNMIKGNAASGLATIDTSPVQIRALGNALGATAHGHGSVDLNVSYVDVIIATKD